MNVTDPINGSHQYTYDRDQLQSRLLSTDEGSYNFTFQVEHYQFWRPLYITVAVNNSIGSSPFSDRMIISGVNNGTIYTVAN